MSPSETLQYDGDCVRWRFRLRKEVFLPGETLANATSVDLIYHQVVNDALAPHEVPYIGHDDRRALAHFLKQNGIELRTRAASDETKLEAVERARAWPTYFARKFDVSLAEEQAAAPKQQPADGSAAIQHQVAVSHNGVALLEKQQRLVQQTGEWTTDIRMLDQTTFAGVDISAWRVGVDRFTAVLGKMRRDIVSRDVPSIVQLVEAYIIESARDAKHALSIKAYETRDATLLSFPKDVVIALASRRGLEPGWLYGTFGGRTGAFPADYVAPIVGDPTPQAIEQARRGHKLRRPGGDSSKHSLEVARTSVKHTGGRALTSAGMGQAPGRTVRTRAGILSDDELLPESKYSMLNFARENYRQGSEMYEMQRSDTGTVRGTVKKVGKQNKRKKKKGLDWSWSELAALVKFSKSPIQASLLRLPDDEDSKETNKMALESFLNIMRFMGDYMAKGRTEVDVVHFLIRAAHRYEFMRDEVYCQLVKQVTNNKSERAESCARGWRLLVISTAFIKPSEELEPYLRSYLQNTAYNLNREFHDEAVLCIRNLKQTMRLGGRRKLPAEGEVRAVIEGKYQKIQKLYMPGDRTKSIKVTSVMVVKDVLADMCKRLGDAHVEEYGLYIRTESNKLGALLRNEDYLLDLTSILEERGVAFRLTFRKMLWFATSRFDNALFNTMIFDQVLPDFAKAHLFVLNELSREFKTDTLPTLVCLQFQALHPQPSLQTLLDDRDVYVPAPLAEALDPQEWVATLTKSYADVVELTPAEARRKFLQRLSRLELYGSRFFPLDNVSDQRVGGAALLAINKGGIRFLDAETHATLLSYTFNEIVSTRRLGSRQSGKHFIDLKLGNLMVQRVTRCETSQSSEITAIISAYIRMFVNERVAPALARRRSVLALDN